MYICNIRDYELKLFDISINTYSEKCTAIDFSLIEAFFNCLMCMLIKRWLSSDDGLRMIMMARR